MNGWLPAAVMTLAATFAGSSWYSTTTAGAASAAGGDLHAPPRLADTGLYAAGSTDDIDQRNRPFAPQYPLWSDGAAKKRWVYLPARSTIDVTSVNAWDFPVGTRFWKEFSFQGRRVETRFLWKASAAGWIAASYLWNKDGTDAVLAPEQGVRGVADIAPGRGHSIPSISDCAACHGGPRMRPLGFTALQLSTDRDPNALHAEPLQAGMVTLQTLMADGFVSPPRPEFVARPPRIATRSAETRTVLGYLATNCGSCHNGEGQVAALGPVLRERDLIEDGDAVARGLVNRATTWQVPGTPEGASVLVDPASPDSSAILVRMRSRRPSSQMPPLGTVVRDEEALDAIARWIATDVTRSRQ
jgi:mono/diheme cytochrome c family protein